MTPDTLTLLSFLQHFCDAKKLGPQRVHAGGVVSFHVNDYCANVRPDIDGGLRISLCDTRIVVPNCPASRIRIAIANRNGSGKTGLRWCVANDGHSWRPAVLMHIPAISVSVEMVDATFIACVAEMDDLLRDLLDDEIASRELLADIG